MSDVNKDVDIKNDEVAGSCADINADISHTLDENKNDKKRSDKKEKPIKTKAVRRTSIGGQAVLEGVMMKGAHSIATAVRTPSGDISVESKYIKSAKERNVFLRLPFVRGVVNLFSQLFQGTGIIMRSAEVYGDFEEPSKFEKWMADKFKINPMSVLMAVSVIIGVAIAIGLFIFLPNFLTGLLFEIPALANAPLSSLWYSLIEGGMMLIIFVAYILLVTLMKDIRRVFMYHGAEHKVISCYEHGLDLTVENAKKMSREHSRCGTTFMFIVITVSILIFVLINWALKELGWLTGQSIVDALIRLGVKILFLPVIAGVSYEILKLLAKSDCLLFRILRAPGMALQKLTTKEPTDDMLEVSLAAFKTVMAMDEDPNMAETTFDIRVPYAVARKRLQEIAKTADDADMDWLLVEVTGKRRSELSSLGTLSKAEYDNAEKIAKKMSDGTPLQYALGTAYFYDIKLAVNQNVLIPRPETEELCKLAIDEINNRQNGDEVIDVLDLCTGSGALALAIKQNCACNMCASDISEQALTVAKANAVNLGVTDVEFVNSDMWNSLRDRAFDVIVTNPPYIPTDDINTLDKKVKDFEPALALDGDKDGLKFYRIIARELDTHLKDGGVLFAEFGIGQAQSIKDIFDGFDVNIVKDIEGTDRIAVVKRV